MAEGGGRAVTPPPAYNEAISSTIYTIPVEASHPPPQPAYPQPDVESIPVDTTVPPASGRNGWQPPSYESLFGIRIPKSRGANAPATSHTPEVEPHRSSFSTRVDVQPTGESNSTNTSTSWSCPSALRCTSLPSCDSDCKEKAKKSFLLTTGVVAVGMCAAITTMGYVYKDACPADSSLSSMLRTSGIIGIVYFCLIALGAYCQHRKQETDKHKPFFFFLFPIVLIILFLYGANKAYNLWMKKPCDPAISNDCELRYCDGDFLLFSFIFYTSSTVLLLPLWLLIFYLAIRLIVAIVGRICCPNSQCFKDPKKWF